MGARRTTSGNSDRNGPHCKRGASIPRHGGKVAIACGDFDEAVRNTLEYRSPTMAPSLLGRLLGVWRCGRLLSGYTPENKHPHMTLQSATSGCIMQNTIADQYRHMADTATAGPDGFRRPYPIPYSVGTVQEIMDLHQNRDRRMLSRRIQLAAQIVSDIWRRVLNLPQFDSTAKPPRLWGRYRPSGDGGEGVLSRIKIEESGGMFW